MSSFPATRGALNVVLYTLPEGACIQRDVIRFRIISKGVFSETTKLIGMVVASVEAWVAVRGKPSSIKEAPGESESDDEISEGEDRVPFALHDLVDFETCLTSAHRA